MSRPLRVEYPGAVYHVMARGTGRCAPDRRSPAIRLSRRQRHYTNPQTTGTGSENKPQPPQIHVQVTTEFETAMSSVKR